MKWDIHVGHAKIDPSRQGDEHSERKFIGLKIFKSTPGTWSVNSMEGAARTTHSKQLSIEHR